MKNISRQPVLWMPASADAWRGAVLCLSLVICASAYSFRFTSFLHVKEGVLCVSVILIALLATASRNAGRGGFTAFLPLWVFVAVALAGVFAVQARSPSEAITKAASWQLLLLGATLVFDLLSREEWRMRVIGSIGVSAALVAALGLVQYTGLCPVLFPVFAQYTQRVYSVFGNQDLYGGYLALGVPILIHGTVCQQFVSVRQTVATTNCVLRRQGLNYPALLGLAVVIPGIMISGSRTAWLAACLGAAAVLSAKPSGPSEGEMMRYGVSRHVPAVAGLVALVMAITLWMTPEATLHRVITAFKIEDRGVQTRLWMWHGTLDMILDAPILGVGLNNYGYWSPRYLGVSVQGPGGNQHILGEFHADQPHSEPLRLLAETGLAGIACWFWMGARVVRAILSETGRGPSQGPALGALLALIAFALFNGPFDSPPHAFAGLLLVGILLQVKVGTVTSFMNQRPPRPDTTRSYWKSLAHKRGYCPYFYALALSAFLIAAVHIPSYLLRAAEDAHLGPQADISRYAHAVNYPWPNALAHKEYGFALAEAGLDDEANRELVAALRGLDTGDIYLALAILSAKRGDREETYRWAAECLTRWPGNPEAKGLIEAQSRVDATSPSRF